jgi:hypothetical protein
LRTDLWCSPAARSRLLSFNRIQSSAVSGLLTGRNTSARHLYMMGLMGNPLCGGCGAEEETSAHVLCGCEASAALRHACLPPHFYPENVRSLKFGDNLEFY